ncbi:hypothetical protein IF803_11315 [Bradyrhizobium sp. UFLA06-06]
MTKSIRAFVGHSFLPEDEIVVRAFTDYLDTLAESLPSFSWDNARRAEPNALTEKVLGIAKDKNLFIGICTAKESAVLTKALTYVWPWQRSSLKANITQFSLKTSDWILQEIGMAIGMGMKTILLQEKGVRRPGGLQGNTEYIEFDRDKPSEAFPSLLQMISSISPKEISAPIAASAELDTERGASEVDPPSPPMPLDLGAPNATWDQAAYNLAALRAIAKKDQEALDKIDEAYRETPSAIRHEDECAWQANIEWGRIRFAFDGSIERLAELAKKNPGSSKVLQSLANAYAFYKERQLSASTYILAANASASVEDKASLLCKSIKQYVADEHYEMARYIADEIRKTIAESSSNESIFLDATADIAKAENDARLYVATLERLVELRPDDSDSRFLLALKQGEIGNNDLSLANYLRVPIEERSSGVWNNLGVQFDHFKLPAKAVDAFTKAADQNETLAMSNLGFRYAEQGFLSAARELGDRAIEIPNHHKNIHDLISRLSEIPESKEKSESAVLSSSKAKGDFYREVGRALGQSDATETVISNLWQSKESSLRASKSEKGIEISGSFERDKNPFTGLLSLISSQHGNTANSQPQKVTQHIRYVGRFYGRAFFGTVTRRSEGGTLLSDADSKHEILMFLSVDGSVLKVLEAEQQADPRYYDLKCEARALSSE